MDHQNMRLVAVFDNRNLKLYETTYHEIYELAVPKLNFKDRKVQGRHASLFHKQSHPTSALEPHTELKSMEYSENAHLVAEYLSDFLKNHQNYGGLIVICEPKMLGAFKKSIKPTTNVKKTLIGYIAKDMVNSKATVIRDLLVQTKFHSLN